MFEKIANVASAIKTNKARKEQLAGGGQGCNFSRVVRRAVRAR